MSTHRPALRTLVLVTTVLLAACTGETTEGPEAASAPPAEPADPAVGTWRAVLSSPGGELPFTLEITEGETGLAAVSINGSERAPFSHVSRTDRLVSLETRWYDSGIQSELSEDQRLALRDVL